MALSDVINVEDIQVETRKVIDESYDTFSYLGRLGSTIEAFGTTRLDVLRTSGAYSLQEGETKKLTPITLDSLTFTQGKTVAAVPISVEALKDKGSDWVTTQVIAGLTNDIIRGMDFAVLLGTNSADGSDVSWLTESNIASNATAIYGSGATGDGNVELGFLDDAYALAPIDSGIALGERAYRALSRARNTFSGNLQNTNFNPNTPFILDGNTAQLVKGLDYTNYAKKKPKAELIDSGVRSIVGDFSNVHLAIDTLDIRFAEEGTFGGINLLETNTKLVLAEIFWKVAVEDISSFVAVKDEETEPVDPEVP